MLAQVVSLGDVRDVEGFVQSHILNWYRRYPGRARRVRDLGLHEELVSEGMDIMCALWHGYEPHREGYEHAGRFSGYAAWAFPKKLGDRVHRLLGDRLVSQPDGSRRWVPADPVNSIDAMTAEDPDRHLALAGSTELEPTDLEGRIRAALLEQSTEEREWVIDVARMTARGEQVAQIAKRLGLTEQLVGRYERMIARALPEPRYQWRNAADLRDGLRKRAELDAARAARVGHLHGQGSTAQEISEILGVEVSEVRDHEESIRRVWHAIETGAGER